MLKILETLLQDDVKPNHLDEVEWLRGYMNSGNPNGDPIFLSLGDNWVDTPNSLISLLCNAPKYTHGYHLSMYGYPPLRKKAKSYIESQNNLQKELWYDQEYLYEVGITATGTRTIMYDFARYLSEKNRHPMTLITMAPAWGYDGVFSSVGFGVEYLMLEPEEGFRPNENRILKSIESISQKGKTVISLNPQHNPSGINWPESILQKIIDKAVSLNIPLLFDDAYFGIHSSSTTPSSGLRLLLETIHRHQKKSFDWIWVRSLGKQFACNGWGVGMVAASPLVLDKIMNNYQTRHHYNINGLFQYALSEFLDSKEANNFVQTRNVLIENNRKTFITRLVTELGYPSHLFPESDCTNFQLFPIPVKYHLNGGSPNFLKETLEKTGILFTDAWPTPYNFTGIGLRFDYARIFLAINKEVLNEAINRMVKVGLYFE